MSELSENEMLDKHMQRFQKDSSFPQAEVFEYWLCLKFEALEKENKGFDQIRIAQNLYIDRLLAELQTLKDDRDSIKEELDELYKGGDPIGMMARASANSYRDMKEFVNKKLDELLNQSK